MSRRKNCSGLARRLPEPAPGLELSAAPARGSNEEIWEAHFGVWIFFRRKEEDWETLDCFFTCFTLVYHVLADLPFVCQKLHFLLCHVFFRVNHGIDSVFYDSVFRLVKTLRHPKHFR